MQYCFSFDFIEKEAILQKYYILLLKVTFRISTLCNVALAAHAQLLLVTLSGRIEPMDELIHCSHRTVYTNQTICWDPIETERSEATIPRRSRGDAKRQTPDVTA